MRQPLPCPDPVLRTRRLKRAVNVLRTRPCPFALWISLSLTVQHLTLSSFQPVVFIESASTTEYRSTFLSLSLSVCRRKDCFWSLNVFVYRGFWTRLCPYVNFRCFSESAIAWGNAGTDIVRWRNHSGRSFRQPEFTSQLFPLPLPSCVVLGKSLHLQETSLPWIITWKYHHSHHSVVTRGEWMACVSPARRRYPVHIHLLRFMHQAASFSRRFPDFCSLETRKISKYILMSLSLPTFYFAKYNSIYIKKRHN